MNMYEKVNELIFVLYRGMYIVSIGIVILAVATYFSQHKLQWEYLLIAVIFFALASCLSFDCAYREYRLNKRFDENGDFRRQLHKLMTKAAGLFVFAAVYWALLKLAGITNLLSYSVVGAAVFAGFALALISLLASFIARRMWRRRCIAESAVQNDGFSRLPPFSACGLWAKCLLAFALACVVLCSGMCYLLYPTLPESVALVVGSVALLVFCYYAMRFDVAVMGEALSESDAFGWAIDVALIDCALLGSIALVFI